MNYETNVMTFKQVNSLANWFDNAIGTDYEINHAGCDDYYVVFIDMTFCEELKLKKYIEHMLK